MKKFDDLMSVSNEIENISASDAKEKLNDPNVQFIDVRDKESFSKGTIGNAIHLDRGLLEFYLAEGSPLENDMFKNNPDKEYVVFCGVGGQGTLATKTMKDMGVKNVKNITGGMKEWEKIKQKIIVINYNKMKLLKNFKFETLKNKYGRYLLLGSFAFFFIKGLIWLGIFIAVGLGITNSF